MKTKNKRNYSKQNGITLIALVVTIVVLLILAGVSLNAIFSENGLINRAKDAQNKMDQATQNDLAQLDELDSWLENQVNGVEKGAKIISFTINSTTYQAEEGMTWRQWIESKYNTIGTITIGESRISNGGDILGYNTKQGPQTVKPDEVINTKYSYQFT
ncbi:MAG: type II secretion system protein [Clostridia bacterium]|jgi:hypothetical protein|nr:type II secretion system protein [Clostridia bacterium]